LVFEYGQKEFTMNKVKLFNRLKVSDAFRIQLIHERDALKKELANIKSERDNLKKECARLKAELDLIAEENQSNSFERYI